MLCFKAGGKTSSIGTIEKQYVSLWITTSWGIFQHNYKKKNFLFCKYYRLKKIGKKVAKIIQKAVFSLLLSFSVNNVRNHNQIIKSRRQTLMQNCGLHSWFKFACFFFPHNVLFLSQDVIQDPSSHLFVSFSQSPPICDISSSFLVFPDSNLCLHEGKEKKVNIL